MPSKRRQLKSGDSQKRVSAHNKRSSRRFVRELCVGCIIWLPEKVAGGESVKCILPNCCNNSELDSRGYKHYVVILDIFQTADNKIQCYVAKLTSKVGGGRYSISRIKISQEASASLPDEESGLFLEHGSMPKQSFISLNHVLQISPKLLRPFKTGNHACETRLSKHSYIYLMNKLGLKATAYKDTNHVKQLGATLLIATPQTPIPPTSAFNQQIPDYEAPRTTSTLPPQCTACKPTNLTPQTSIPSTSALVQYTPNYKAQRTVYTLPPQSTASKPTNPTPQTMPNRPTRPTTTREPNPSEPYRGEIAQKFDLEAYSLFQTYQTRRRESEQIRVQDLDIGGHGESSGSGIWCRCAQCLLEKDVHEEEHASFDKLGLFFFIVLLFLEVIFKVVRTTVRVLGAGLKWAGLWGWKTVKYWFCG